MMQGRTLWFPGKTKKAITLSYDDGKTFDIKLCEIMAKHGVKGTFNINSELGSAPRHMPIEDCIALYKKYGFETAYHGAKHLMYPSVTPAQVMLDVVNDRIALERATGDFIIGGAYPFGAFNADVKEIHRLAGIRYSRVAYSNNGFEIPTDFLEWVPTCHHAYKDLMPLLEKFLAGKPWMAQIFFLWGHSYEFNDDDNWEIIERFCERVEGEPVWHATNGEIYEYVTAYRSLRFSADESVVYNPTHMDIWFANMFADEPILVPAGKTIRVETGEIIK